MWYRNLATMTLLGSLVAGWAVLCGCESMDGNRMAVAPSNGPATTTAATLAADDQHRLAALLGEATGGGYVIAADLEMTSSNDRAAHREQALCASARAERSPAGVEDVRRAETADLNADGFVTLDEVVALERAGMDDRQEIARLAATKQAFELTEQQERYLEDRGIGRAVIREMRAMNAGYGAVVAKGKDR